LTRSRISFFPALGLLIAGLCLSHPAAAVEVPIEQSQKVKALPPAVLKTVLAEGKGATVRNVLTEKDSSGATLYEVEMRISGLTKDIVVGADGTLLVSEQQMKRASLPPAVRATIDKAAAGRKIRMIESVSKGARLEFYEAHVVSGKTLAEIKVGLDGTLIP
jgi:negative regulator of replication initiation